MSIDRDKKRLNLTMLKDELGLVWQGIDDELSYWNCEYDEDICGEADKLLQKVTDILNERIGRLTCADDLKDDGTFKQPAPEVQSDIFAAMDKDKAQLDALSVYHPPARLYQDYTDDYGNRIIHVHAPTKECFERGCTIHNHSEAAKKQGKQLWRHDRQMFERVCEHGVGQPDYDQITFWSILVERGIKSQEWFNAEMVHGACGECANGS